MNAASARGRSAEYFGPGVGNANIQKDITVRTEDIPNRAQTWLQTGGAEQAAIIQAFTDGVNEYTKRHGDTIDPSFRQVLPFVPTDITAGIQNTIHFHFMPEQDNLPDLISAWQTGGITPRTRWRAVSPLAVPQAPRSRLTTRLAARTAGRSAQQKAPRAMPFSWVIRIRLGATIHPSHPSMVLESTSGWRSILSSGILRILT